MALLQTSWYRNDNPAFQRLTRFFGTLLLINVAIGVVTGLVQEFEFGMNWSNYSRFVGNIFGGPLAMEGLVAFFLESTFLGVWIFGWDRLSKKLHLACIWLVAAATMLSAAFIMAANSWMQHPVGLRDELPAPAAAQRHLGPVHQPGVPLGLPARRSWPRWSPGPWSCWPSRRGTSGARARSPPSAGPPSSPWSSSPRPCS